MKEAGFLGEDFYISNNKVTSLDIVTWVRNSKIYEDYPEEMPEHEFEFERFYYECTLQDGRHLYIRGSARPKGGKLE